MLNQEKAPEIQAFFIQHSSFSIQHFPQTLTLTLSRSTGRGNRTATTTNRSHTKAEGGAVPGAALLFHEGSPTFRHFLHTPSLGRAV
jgi:hypothetical protein